jgi:hypothetical protein
MQLGLCVSMRADGGGRDDARSPGGAGRGEPTKSESDD